jgi:hypothetical protein
MRLVLFIAAVIALPIAAQAANNKAAHKVKTALGKTKSPSTVDKPKVDTPIDSYSQTR